MESWILDDGVLDLLARVVTPDDVRTAPCGFYVAEETVRSAEGERKRLLDGAPNPFRVIRIEEGTRAFDLLYCYLRAKQSATSNLAEHQAIAWAMLENRAAIFTTVDMRAAMTAPAELGRGRVAHAFDLWIFLRDKKWISERKFRQLCTATRKKDQALPGIPRRCGLSRSV